MQTEVRVQPWNTDRSRAPGSRQLQAPASRSQQGRGALGRRHALVLAALVLGAIPFGQAALLSVAIGGAIAMVNLRLLERSVGRMLGAPGGPSGLAMRLFLHLRLVLLFGIVVVVLVRAKLPLIPFTIGLSSAVPAVLWHGWSARET